MTTFRDEMEQQPTALRHLAARYAAEPPGPEALAAWMSRRPAPAVFFAGMGSSLYASYVPVHMLRCAGIPAMAVEPADLLPASPALDRPDVLWVAVSQSGESPETVALAEGLPDKRRLVCVSNNPESRLRRACGSFLEIHAGIERLTSTKTYTNTLAALQWLALALAARPEGAFKGLHRQWLASAELMESLLSRAGLGPELAAFMAPAPCWACVGSGCSYASASHSEIVLEEAGKFFSSRYTPGQFLHGPIELIGPEYGVLLYDLVPTAHEACARVAEATLRHGGRVVWILAEAIRKAALARGVQCGGTPGRNLHMCALGHEDAFTAPLPEILPLEIAVNEIALGRGQRPGRLSRVVKRGIPGA